MFRISPIVDDEFTVTVDREIVSGCIDNPTSTIVEETTRYRTNPDGQGLWAWLPSGAYIADTYEPVYEWKQILGTSQFSLYSVKDTRGYLIRHFIETPYYEHSYGRFIGEYDQERPKTINQARDYYRYLKNAGLAA